LAAVLEVAVCRMRKEFLVVKDVAEPPLVVLVAGDQPRGDRAPLGFAKQGRRARWDAFDRPRPTLDLFDVNAGMQVFSRGDSPQSQQRACFESFLSVSKSQQSITLGMAPLAAFSNASLLSPASICALRRVIRSSTADRSASALPSASLAGPYRFWTRQQMSVK